MCIFGNSITFAQNQNFYLIKETLDAYYDSLIQINGIDNMEGTDYNPYKRWVDYWEPKVYPDGNFAVERQKLEQYVSEFLSGNNPQSYAPFSLNWELIGPDKMPEGNTKWDKGLGQIHYISFDPNDTTNQKMFACSPAGGLWRSVDGGENWINAGTDKGLPLCGVSSVAIDTENSDTHWFVSTGNGEPMPGRFWAQNAIGLGRTTDGGENWQIIGLENVLQMRKVILKRYQSKIHLFVATTNGLYECEDALATEPQFTKLLEGNFYDIEFDPQNSGIAYASGTGSNTSVYKIDWINNNYQELPNISSIPIEDGRRLIIEISPAAPQYLFIVATYGGELNTSFLYRYDLASEILFNKGELPKQYGSLPGIGTERGMGWAISPVLNNNGELIMVYGNTAPIKLSNNLLNNATCTWTNVTSSYLSCEIHVDMHYMKFEPDGQTLWVGSDGGVFKSTMPDLINNWEEKCNGLAVATIYRLAVSEENQNIALGGAFDCGTNLYKKNNNEWSEKHVLSEDGFQCQINWADPDMMWASSQFKVYRSDNGGQDFSYKCSGFHWETFFIQNNVYPGILYGTNPDGIKRTINYGNSWQNYANYPGVNNNKTWRVTNSITNGDYIYTSWYGNDMGDPQKVFKSITGGGANTTDWEDVGSPLINSWINSIAVDYYNPDRIWVAAGSKVYDVNTITHQWIDISTGLPSYIHINHLEILKGSEGVLYAGTNYGLYYYTEDESTWQYVDGNLPNVDIHDIQIDLTNNRIVVSTFGRGIWQAGLPCVTNNDTTYISSNQTWSLDNYIGGTLIIDPNYILTIQNSIVRMNNTAKIIVKPGAKLILDGGTLTNACSEPWQGIRVLGNPGLEQTPQNQGTIEIVNGGTIENADIAVRLGNDDGSQGGGIIAAYDARFLNNNVAVMFDTYSHFDNQSGFERCTFDYDENIAGLPGFTHVVMQNVRGVTFTNCDFLNNYEIQMFGTGIQSTNARFSVGAQCTEYNGSECTQWDFGMFQNLRYGIYATAATALQFADIMRNDFAGNFKGVYLAGMTDATVKYCNFAVDAPFATDGGYGLYLDYCNDYTVEENNFYHDGGSSGHQSGVGLIVNQSGGQPNEIYRNDFTNLECGMNIQGENRSRTGEGLQLRCNEYDQTLMDKIITWDEGDENPLAGIAENQGASSDNPEDMAGNLFQIDGAANGDYDDILNEGNHITYYYPSNAPGFADRVKPVDYTENTVTPMPKTVSTNWTYENGCPPHETGGGGTGMGGTEGLRSAMEQSNQKIDSTENLLAILIDGGNTDVVQSEVDNSVPQQTMQVYGELMNKSPYLSDTVISTAIEKEDVLPAAMIRDIMVANPKAAKSEQLVSKLDERWTPLPDYMKAQILQGRSIVSIREETESQLAAFKLQKARYFNALIRHYLNDTLNPQASLDSLAALLQNENSPYAKYRLAFLKGSQGQWNEGTAILDAVPAAFELTARQQQEHTQMVEYYTLLSALAQQGKSPLQADSTQIDALKNIEQSAAGRISAYARGILLALDESQYTEPIILPDLLKASEAVEEFEKLVGKANEAPGILSVHPNPAKDYIIVGYEFETETDATVAITGLKGNTRFSRTINGKRDQFTVDTRHWEAGTYIAVLKINGKIIESVKFTVIN